MHAVIWLCHFARLFLSSVKTFHFAFYLPLLGAIFGMALSCAWAQDSTQDSAQEMIALPPPLITEAVDESKLTTLKGNTHPLARPELESRWPH